MKLKTSLAVGAATPLLLIVAVVVAYNLFWTATMKLVNNSGHDLSNVRLVTFNGKDEYIAESRLLAPKERVVVDVHIADLYVREVTFTLEGKIITEQLNGIACWGETRTITVLPDGKIKIY